MTHRPRFRAAVTVAMLLSATAAGAQVAQPPPRPSRPRFGGGRPADPNRVRHDLTLDASVLGGYEDYTAPLGLEVPGADLRPKATSGTGNLSLRYAIGTDQRGLDVTGRGSGLYASTDGSSRQPATAYGGDVSLHARTRVARTTGLNVYQTFTVMPYTSLGLFGGFGGGGDGFAGSGFGRAALYAPDAAAANALFQGRSWGSLTSASADRRLTRGLGMLASYSYQRQAAGDRRLVNNRAHFGNLILTQQIGRSFGISVTYGPSLAERMQGDQKAAALSQRIDVGLSTTRRISRTRTLTLSGGGGSTHVDDRDVVRQKYWLPTAFAAANVDLGRSWTVAADWRQAAAYLPTVLFTPYTFKARSLAINVGGQIVPRVELVVNGRSTNGGRAQLADATGGEYVAYAGSAQLRVGLTRWWSAMVAYNRYQARVRGALGELLEDAATLERSSVSAGFTWSVPLIGGTQERTRRGGRKGR